jgi:hypothetical protein
MRGINMLAESGSEGVPKKFNKMKINAPKEEILNYGLKLAMDWGTDWFKPIQERLLARFHFLSNEELDQFNETCQASMSFGHKIVYEMAEKDGAETNKEEFKIKFVEKYPWATDENISHLFSQGMYYAWKDIGF